MGNVFISELSIEALNLSVRSFNCLKRNNIKNVEQLLQLKEEDLIAFKNLGTKSLCEINDVISKISSGKFETRKSDTMLPYEYINKEKTLLDLVLEQDKIASQVLIYDENTHEYKDDLSIDDLNLSVRSFNALNNTPYSSVKKILQLKIETFNKIKNLGKKSKDEIVNKLRKVLEIVYSEETKENSVDDQIIKNILDEYNKCGILLNINIMRENIYMALKRNTKIINLEKNNEKLIYNKEFLDYIYNIDYFNKFIRTYLIKLISSKERVITLASIKKNLPKHLQGCEIISQNINSLVEEKQIEKYKDGYRIYYQNLMNYVDTIEDERKRYVLKRRFEGEKLSEIGNELNVTREWVRQIERKAIKEMPRIREDDYKSIFEKYDWPESLFLECYNENKLTYAYLNNRYIKGTLNIEMMLGDYDIEVDIRMKAERIIFKDYIIIGSSKVKKERSSILQYVLKTFCKEDVTCDELWDLYHMFLEDYGLDKNKEMLFTNRYFETALARSNEVLWKLRKKLRYYDTHQISSTEIIESLGLDQFKDVEYSTLKFFRDYNEVMELWDIRDEYELHNLMKKVISEDNEYNIKFNRMPNVEFGIADRDMQVLDVLLQTAPIEYKEISIIYEDTYGVRADTVQANFLKCIDEYLHEGIYSIDYDDLSIEETNTMKLNLVEDIYSIEKIRKLYINLFSNGDIKLITPYNLKKLGFRVNGSLIYSDKFLNAERCIKHKICKNDIFNSNLLDKGITTNQTYYCALQALKSNLQVIEFSPNQFINIRRLEGCGITKIKLKDYIDKVYDFIGSKVFTIKHLREKGFTNELDDLGFEDLFYGSILLSDSRFNYRRVGKQILLSTIGKSVTINDLIEHIVSKYRSIDIYDLMDYMKDRYGINVEKCKIQTMAKDIDLYYDSIMEKVYIDYDEYFEEV